MRMKVLYTAVWFFASIQCFTAQITDTFPSYIPDTISAIRLEYARQSRYEEVIAFFRRWETYRGLPKTHEDSAAWYTMQSAFAYTFFDLRQLDSAEAVLTPVLNVSVDAFPLQSLQIKNAWGVRLIYGGRFAEAKKHYEKMRVLLDNKKLPATPQQYCNTVHNLGVANQQLGDTDAALEVFNHIEDVIRENDIKDNRLKSNLQLNMAGAYMALGEYAQAIEHSRKAHAISVEEYGTDHPFSAQTLTSVANNMQQSGDLEGALKTYRECLAIYERIGRTEHPLRTVSLLNAAETLDKMGRQEEAMQYLIPCISIRRQAYGMRHSEVARAYKAKGTILRHMGRFDEALMSLDTALLALGFDAQSENPYSGVDAMFNLFYTLDHKADIYYDRAINNPDEANLVAALDAYIQGIHVLNDLRVHFKGRLAKGNLNHKSYNFYEPAIDVSLKLYERSGIVQDLEQAMQWSGESKGNDFYDLIRGENAMISAKVPDSVRARDDKFQQDLAELESTWYEVRNDDEKKVVEARQALDHTRKKYRAWLETVETQYPMYFELLHANTSLDVKERQVELLESSSQLIEYFVGDSNAFAFILTPEALHFVRLSHPDSLGHAVHRWRDDVVSSSALELQKLSRFVWQPLAPYLKQQEHLVIIPDGVLSSIPFEILEDEDGNLVLDQYDISYNYSSRSMALHSAVKKNQRWLGMAPEYSMTGGSMAMASRGLDSAVIRLRDMEWMKLPGAESEVNTIGDLTGGERRIGKTATEGFFRKMAGKFGILHLSMHAWTDDDEPLLSTLVFADEGADSDYDGRLYAHEIFQLDLPARLAVLSACNTGVGAFRRGEGISSLARAFMYAGTEATVMSLWKVPDESTAIIMQALYTHLRNGERKDEALRHAKLDYLNSVSEPEQKRPYYWAGFVLMGDPAPVYGGGFPIGIAGIIGGVLLLIGLMIWMKKRS